MHHVNDIELKQAIPWGSDASRLSLWVFQILWMTPQLAIRKRPKTKNASMVYLAGCHCENGSVETRGTLVEAPPYIVVWCICASVGLRPNDIAYGIAKLVGGTKCKFLCASRHTCSHQGHNEGVRIRD